jgi:hypothetical protein
MAVFSLIGRDGRWGADPEVRNQMRARNEQLLRSGKKAERYTTEEVDAIIMYGVREPSLQGAFEELARVLADMALPRIQELFRRAVSDFGFSHLPWAVR